MSRFRRSELIEESFCCYTSSPLFFSETSILLPKTPTFPSFVEESLHLDLLPLPTPFDAVSDLLRIHRTPSFSYRRVPTQLGTEFCLQSLSDRVAELEVRFDRLVAGKSGGCGDRKYTWTAEIKGPEKNGFDRKYKWVAEMVEEEKKKLKKNIKWTAEIKGKGEDSGSTRKYTFQVESGDSEKKVKEKEKEKEKEKKKGSGLRIVEIKEPSDHRDVVLRQVW